MEKPSNDLFDSSFALFDHRSEAFRQKMFEHFLAKRSQLWPDIEEILENNESANLSKYLSIGTIESGFRLAQFG
jgi:deoxyribodipyrimidine photolyase